MNVVEEWTEFPNFRKATFIELNGDSNAID
jgi:hypothetical protein